MQYVQQKLYQYARLAAVGYAVLILVLAGFGPQSASAEDYLSKPKILKVYACPSSAYSPACFDAAYGVKSNEWIVINYGNVSKSNESTGQAIFDADPGNVFSGKYVDPQGRPSGGLMAVAMPLETVANKPGAHTVSVSFSGVGYSDPFTFSVSTGAGGPEPSGGVTPAPSSNPELPRPSLDPEAGGSVTDGLKNIADQFTAKGELAQSRTVGEVIVAIINVLLSLLFALVVLMVIYGGFLYVTAGGADDRAKKGKKVITQALIGMAIVILAYVLVSTISNALDGNI